MRNIFLVARREYLEQIRSRVFRITTISVPVVIGAILYFNRSSHDFHGGKVNPLMTAFFMAFLLTFTGILYGLNVGRAIIAEKTSRIFEVLLASARPEDLMFGKLIGVGAVGLTQIGFWIACAALYFDTKLSGNGPAIEIPPVQLVLFAIYFLLGYLFYSGVSAAMASTVSSEQELQQMVPINAVPVWLSFSLVAYIHENPNGLWSMVLSFIPPCTPIVIFIRMGSTHVPAWQIIVSAAFLAVTVYAIVWFATRLYRVGILMYGKRATLSEVLRWIRYS